MDFATNLHLFQLSNETLPERNCKKKEKQNRIMLLSPSQLSCPRRTKQLCFASICCQVGSVAVLLFLIAHYVRSTPMMRAECVLVDPGTPGASETHCYGPGALANASVCPTAILHTNDNCAIRNIHVGETFDCYVNCDTAVFGLGSGLAEEILAFVFTLGWVLSACLCIIGMTQSALHHSRTYRKRMEAANGNILAPQDNMLSTSQRDAVIPITMQPAAPQSL